MSAGVPETPQHYVPETLLRGFTTTQDGEQIWVFDKRTLHRDDVRFQNSLQAVNAEGFVIASVNDFADVAQIIENNPDARLVLVQLLINASYL